MLALSMAHDLNNILTPILTATQILKKSFPDPNVKTLKLFDILQTNVKHGAKLVQQVLSFSRGIPGKHGQVQIECLILEVKDFAQRMFSKSIKIYTYIQSDLHPISGDVTQLYQLLMNLCINARDAMPKGGTLDISVENIFIDENHAWMSPDAKTGSYIEIKVSDTGIGIMPEIKDKIFEPFFTTKLDNGTGLGLSTVKTIVKNHGGFIHVFSQVGEGTIFKVYLPALQQKSQS